VPHSWRRQCLDAEEDNGRNSNELCSRLQCRQERSDAERQRSYSSKQPTTETLVAVVSYIYAGMCEIQKEKKQERKKNKQRVIGKQRLAEGTANRQDCHTDTNRTYLAQHE